MQRLDVLTTVRKALSDFAVPVSLDINLWEMGKNVLILMNANWAYTVHKTVKILQEVILVLAGMLAIN